MIERISYTVREAAEATGLSEDTIRKAYRSGLLPVYYPTSKPMILRSDLEAWIANSPTERQSA